MLGRIVADSAKTQEKVDPRLVVEHPTLGLLTISDHAWDRFHERRELLGAQPIPADNAIKRMNKFVNLLTKSVREEPDHYSFTRKLHHISKDGRIPEIEYWMCPGSNLRFVIEVEQKIIVTVEIAGPLKHLNKTTR